MKSLALALLFVPITLFAANATVDCTGATPGAFMSINAAIATLDTIGPHNVFVSGTCVENVLILGHDRLTLQGNPAATIQAASGTALRIDRSRAGFVRRITVTGGGTGVALQRNADAVLEGVTIENAGIGLSVFDGAIANLGGANAATQSVLIRNNNIGGLFDGATVIMNGNVTIEDNATTGVDAEASRVAILGNAAPNAVRDNGGNGVFAHGTSDVDFRGVNQITGNGFNGVFAFENTTIDILGNTTQFTTISGNQRGGVVFLFNSSGRVGNAVIANNGTAGNPLSSGLTVANNSSAIVNFSTITGSNGPGAIVDSGSMARIFSTTISGGTAEPIRLITGGVLELQTGNTLTGVGTDVVVCDDSAVLFGDGANVSTSCKKTK